MYVKEVMTKGVVICAATDTLARAGRLMWDHDVGVLPVQRGAQIVGMITDRDIAMAVILEDRSPGELLVEDSMSFTIFVCSPDDSVAIAEEMMADHGVRRLPVVEEGVLVGILSLDDLARASASGSEVSSQEVIWTLSAVITPRPLVGPIT